MSTSMNCSFSLLASIMIMSTVAAGSAERIEMKRPETLGDQSENVYALSKDEDTLVFNKANRDGLAFLQDFSGTPNERGELGAYTLDIPEFTRGVLYSDRKMAGSWRGGGNQFFPNILFGDYGNVLVHRRVFRGAFIVFQLKDGGYLALLPVSSHKTMSWIQAENAKTLKLYYATLGTKPVNGDVPLVAWSKSESIYDACRKVWELARMALT